MQNSNSLPSLPLRLTLKLALPFAVVTLLTLIGLAVYAQSRYLSPVRESVTSPFLTVSHAASGGGVVSPGCAAVITGGVFASEAQQVLHWPLPLSMAGVTVKIGGIEAAIYAVDVNKIRIIVPDVPRKTGMAWDSIWQQRFTSRELLAFGRAFEGLSAVQSRLIQWYRVEAVSPFGNYSGWAALAPTSPGFYEQTDTVSGQIVPQGVYVAEGQAPRLITAEPIPNAKTALILTGTGFLRATALFAYISDEADGYWVVPITASRIGLFDWIENITIPIPTAAHGRLTITAQADAMWSQQIQVVVQ